MPDRFTTSARVLPGMRRRGVGTALLLALVAHAERFVDLARADVEDDGSRLFAERFGFAERDREVEQVKRLADEPAPGCALPDGIEVVTIAERPELLREAYPPARATRTSPPSGRRRSSRPTGSARRRRCPRDRSSPSQVARSWATPG
jgi:hypothetical protein